MPSRCRPLVWPYRWEGLDEKYLDAPSRCDDDDEDEDEEEDEDEYGEEWDNEDEDEDE